MRRIYLDHLASTPVLPEVFETMRPFFTGQPANPSSLHQGGLLVRDAMDLARGQAAGLIGAGSSEEILFTSGGTESANLAIKGAASAGQRHGRHIVTSTIEHPAVMRSLEALEQQGYEVTRLPVDREGILKPDSVQGALRPDTILVATHLANHDIGTLQPVREIAAICNEATIPIFVDASFAGGWEPINVQSLGVNLLSLSPHRFCGPKGVGVLFKSSRTRLHNLTHGGVQEHGFRPGTENVPGIVGAGKAAELASASLNDRLRHVSTLQRLLMEALAAAVPDCRLNGPPPGATRLCTHLNVSFPGVEGEGVMLRSDLKGVAFSSGSACISKTMKTSPVLREIGVDPELALGSVLLSPGLLNTADEMREAAVIIAGVVRDLRALA